MVNVTAPLSSQPIFWSRKFITQNKATKIDSNTNSFITCTTEFSETYSVHLYKYSVCMVSTWVWIGLSRFCRFSPGILTWKQGLYFPLRSQQLTSECTLIYNSPNSKSISFSICLLQSLLYFITKCIGIFFFFLLKKRNFRPFSISQFWGQQRELIRSCSILKKWKVVLWN